LTDFLPYRNYLGFGVMLSMDIEALAARIRAEYREMSGLQLTFAQARMLWQLDPATCSAVLQSLVDEGFLIGTSDGRFIAASTDRTPVRRRA
jgi:hypothetical protein